jgi:hypothetical protein
MKDVSKFSGPFMQKSPLYDKSSRLRKRAQKRSKRLGETQDYAYEDPKVQRLLSKAKEAEKPKYSLEDDTRVSMSYERPDMPPINYGSPLNEAVTGEYGSASGYVSIEPAIRRLQENISQTTEPSAKKKDKKTSKKNQVVDTSTGEQINASKPTKDLSNKTNKYNQFQDLTRVQSVDGNLMRVDGKGNMYSMKFDELGKKVLDMDELSKAAKIMTRR